MIRLTGATVTFIGHWVRVSMPFESGFESLSAKITAGRKNEENLDFESLRVWETIDRNCR